VADEVNDEVIGGLGVRGPVTGVTKAVNIERNEGSTRNRGRNDP